MAMKKEILEKIKIDEDLKRILSFCECRLVTSEIIHQIKSNDITNKLYIDVEYDLIYQKLYIGSWKDVAKSYRDLFVILSILKAYLIGRNAVDKNSLLHSLHLADLGIIIGGDSNYCDILKELAEDLHEYLVQHYPHDKITSSIEFETSTDACDLDSIEQTELSLETFWSQYLLQQKPVVIKNAILHWDAYQNWKDIEYLKRIAGYRTVPIELGQKYDAENWSQGLFKFEEFLRLYFQDPEYENREVAYLAQHDLFDQIPRLKRDIKIPEYCAISEVEPVIKAWIGPKNTISSMHTDPKENLLCQVFGEKLLILAAPEDSSNLYPHEGILNNTSQVDPTNVDYQEFPLAKKARFYKVCLKAGDMLFIPKFWWHYVQSLTPSASVSFWFEIPTDD